jgi:putative spermidine/putrescine transport system substrate-binding protein
MKYIVSLIAGFSLLLFGAVSSADSNAEAEAFRDAFLAGELSWDDVLAQAAEEGEVNWFYWGGAQALNAWVDGPMRSALKEHGIELNVRHITNTRDAVDLALAEAAVGRGLGQGSVDTIWINGENFLTLGENDLLFGSFADKVPSSVNFNWDASDPASGANLYDFGYPTLAREIPWGSAQFLCAIDTSRLSPEDAPTTFAELETWVKANPGRFTYVAPPQFTGNTFVHEAMYAHNPDGTGHEPFMNFPQTMTAAEIARVTKPGMEYLKRIEPYLLGGKNPDYPKDPVSNKAMVANGEVDMLCRFGIGGTVTDIKNGELPPTMRNHIFPRGYLIQNKAFITITGNAPHPAAALVLANLIGSVDMQVSWMKAYGGVSGMDASELSAADLAKVADAFPDPMGVDPAEVSANTVPDANAGMVDVVEAIWLAYIQQGDTERSFEQIVADIYAVKFPAE